MLKIKLMCAAAMFAIIGCSAAASTTAALGAPAAAPVMVSAATVAPILATAAQTPAVTSVSHDFAEASCDVRVRRTPGGARVEARVFSDTALEADYSFDLDVSGGGNSSVVNQGGAVSLEAGEVALIAQNEVSLGRGSRLRAELVVHDGAGEVCRRTLRL